MTIYQITATAGATSAPGFVLKLATAVLITAAATLLLLGAQAYLAGAVEPDLLGPLLS